MVENVMIISPHPDDESVGCGGTIRKHVVEGDFVEVIFITSGERGGHGMPPKETAITREREAKNAANVLGYNKIDVIMKMVTVNETYRSAKPDLKQAWCFAPQ